MMPFRPLLIPAFLAALAVTLVPGTAPAAPSDPLGFHFVSSSLSVDENAGDAVITVTRSDTSKAAEVRYITIGKTAVAPYDYTPEKSVVSFAAGQANATFDVPIVNHGADTVSKTIQVSLFGPSPIGLATPNQTTLTILYNDPVGEPDPTDPLGIPGDTVGKDPLTGARFFVDPRSTAAMAVRRHSAIKAIADEPGIIKIGSSSYPTPTLSVSDDLTRASVEEPGTVPLLSTHQLVAGHCGHYADSPSQVAAFEQFITAFAQGIGSYRAVLFLEQDSLITSGCLSAHGLAERTAELNFAIQTLETDCPHLVIYLDGGSADALAAKPMAALLNRAGVAKVQGFFLNASHFDWTRKEIKYGDQISKLTGGKHFVVNTGENGQGPLVPKNRVKNGNEVLCNPPGRGLGPKPTSSTGYPNVDAFAWLDSPGTSGGACVPGAPPTGAFWPAYALMLIKHADYSVR